MNAVWPAESYKKVGGEAPLKESNKVSPRSNKYFPPGRSFPSRLATLDRALSTVFLLFRHAGSKLPAFAQDVGESALPTRPAFVAQHVAPTVTVPKLKPCMYVGPDHKRELLAKKYVRCLHSSAGLSVLYTALHRKDTRILDSATNVHVDMSHQRVPIQKLVFVYRRHGLSMCIRSKYANACVIWCSLYVAQYVNACVIWCLTT